jgi:hypothetical protein
LFIAAEVDEDGYPNLQEGVDFGTYEAASICARNNSAFRRWSVFKLVEVATFREMRNESLPSTSG